MKFWGRYSRKIYKLLAQRRIRRLKPKLIEAVLAKSVFMLDAEMLVQIRSFIANQQVRQGGFADRAGKCDLYYTLFGFYLAEAFNVEINHIQLEKYVRESAAAPGLAGVHRYCAAILYARLIGTDEVSEKLRKEIVAELGNLKTGKPDYSLANDQPCPVIAARSVLQSFTGGVSPDSAKSIMTFYRETGGFAALHQAPEQDLLSTAVALFALHFMDADIRIIKPACLAFTDAMYENGGFTATADDTQPDIEYTFYGMLALGSMNQSIHPA